MDLKSFTAHMLRWGSLAGLVACTKVSIVAAIAHETSPEAVMYLVFSAIFWWVAWEVEHYGS